MHIEFDKQYLQELYEQGRCSDKKHRYQPEVVKGYRKCIDTLIVADCMEVLYRIVSLNCEMLVGDKVGISSVRINRKYRLEFSVRKITDEPIVTICTILEISNHYK